MFASAEDKFIVSTNVNTFFQDYFGISLVAPSPKRKKNIVWFHGTLLGGLNCFEQIQ